MALSVVPFVVLAALFLFATIDIRQHDGRVLRGVSLGDVDISGFSPEELDRELDSVSAVVESAPVYIETPDAAYQIDAQRLGLSVDRSATISAALDVGRQGSAVTRPFGWLARAFGGDRVDAVLDLDPEAAEAGLAAVSRTISIEPGPPTMSLVNGRLELAAGEAGSILDVTRLVRDLSGSLPSQPGDEINVEAFTTTDSMIDVSIQALVDRLNGNTSEPITLRAGSRTAVFEPAEFRGWLRLDTTAEPAVARLDGSAMAARTNELLETAQPSIETRSLIVEGNVLRLPEENATTCCTPDMADDVLESVLSGQTTIDVELVTDDRGPLIELGLRQLIGEFTTNHPAGQDRVLNIQRMAEIVRGAVIQPGEEFSLNAFVGERTADRGFVAAGVIYDGVFAEDIGGGVSQFATTLFNAAFFAGLDLNDYQAHSIYIDRYPYGREATVNWPSVDLKIGNSTEAPVLIWSEFTDSSITVKLFGTAWVAAEQTDQEVTMVESCTRVRTERTRVWLDGREEVDNVFATYQPSEGVGCDGRPTKPPPECVVSEILIDTDEDGFGDTCAPTSEICPPDTRPVDSDGDGDVDICELGPTSCEGDLIPLDTNSDGTVDRCVTLQTPTDPPTAEGTDPVDTESDQADAEPTPQDDASEN